MSSWQDEYLTRMYNHILSLSLSLSLTLRTVAAEVRKQVSREYGSPQLSKKRSGTHQSVSESTFFWTVQHRQVCVWWSCYMPSFLKIENHLSASSGADLILHYSCRALERVYSFSLLLPWLKKRESLKSSGRIGELCLDLVLVRNA